MSYKLLDSNGLSKLWTKIKNTFVKISDIGKTVCPIINNYIPVEYIEQDNRINTVIYYSQVVKINSSYTIIVVNYPNNGNIVLDLSKVAGPLVIDINTCFIKSPIELDDSIFDRFMNFNGSNEASSRLEAGCIYRIVYDDVDNIAYCDILN